MRKDCTGSRGCPSFFPGNDTTAGRRASTFRVASVEQSIVVASPVGRLILTEQDSLLISVGFASEDDTLNAEPTANPILEAAALQLRGYFEDPRARFSLPLGNVGTPFQRRVWTVLTEIPPGHIETYGSLARRLASGPRAIAAACRSNAFAIVIPCHRVVSAHGLGGYCGQMKGPMLEIKRWLLRHEGCPRD